MLAVADQVPDVRSKSSAEERSVPDAPNPPTTSTLPVDRTVAVCAWRAFAIEPVVDQAGSRSAGYVTPVAGQVTRTRQLAAPAGVTGRSHGADGSLSAAHPSTAIVASVRT